MRPRFIFPVLSLLVVGAVLCLAAYSWCAEAPAPTPAQVIVIRDLGARLAEDAQAFRARQLRVSLMQPTPPPAQHPGGIPMDIEAARARLLLARIHADRAKKELEELEAKAKLAK